MIFTIHFKTNIHSFIDCVSARSPITCWIYAQIHYRYDPSVIDNCSCGFIARVCICGHQIRRKAKLTHLYTRIVCEKVMSVFLFFKSTQSVKLRKKKFLFRSSVFCFRVIGEKKDDDFSLNNSRSINSLHILKWWMNSMLFAIWWQFFFWGDDFHPKIKHFGFSFKTKMSIVGHSKCWFKVLLKNLLTHTIPLWTLSLSVSNQRDGKKNKKPFVRHRKMSTENVWHTNQNECSLVFPNV